MTNEELRNIGEFETDDDWTEEDYIMHYGTPRHSGRYPWGSGDSPFQRSSDFLSRVTDLKKEGMTESEIAEALGITSDRGTVSSTRLRALVALATRERTNDIYSKAKTLREEGVTYVEIADRLGLKGESTVRSILRSDSKARSNLATDLADTLKTLVDERGMIDIGVGVPRQLKVSKEKMDQAIEILKMQDYVVLGGGVPQITNKGKQTILKVLCPPGTPRKEIYNYDQINSISDLTSYDEGKTVKSAFQYPESMDSGRIKVRYSDEGGSDKDGVIELRRGVDDISLGTSNYSQVRILVDGSHYLKGMALYSDDIPDGFDLVFNTNKKPGDSKLDAMKPIKSDPDNPFGSTVKETGGQSEWIDQNGERHLSLINKTSDEGDWGNWSKEISAQFLSKQPQKLINRQIETSIQERQAEFDEIRSLTNPTIKESLLVSFADDCDAAAVSLKAAGLPGVKYKVILPVNSLKDNEVYAPHLEDGSYVALVRYPHAGTFEIPQLQVNNRNKEGVNSLTAQPTDAIGINKNVAAILSGADFDGDTVQVIPITDKIKIKSTPQLKDLIGFDTKMDYGYDEVKVVNGEERYYRGGREFKILKDSATQNQMGTISNLITDMTLLGATNQELARAVKHSMVIIDANKHKLDYKQSEVDNGIKALHKKYQSQVGDDGRIKMGAATLISRAKSDQPVGERKLGGYFANDTGNRLTIFDIDNKIYLDEKTGKFYNEREKRTKYIDETTGEKLYTYTNREYRKTSYKTSDGKNKKVSVFVKDGDLFYKDEDGLYTRVTDEDVKRFPAQEYSTKMAEAKDARALISVVGTPQEEAYAEYANKLKAMANEARKESLTIIHNPYSPSAKQTYIKEFNSLNYKLNQALLNAPRERHAQLIANSIVTLKKQENPSMGNEAEKKLKQQELSRARIKVGAQRTPIEITQSEWNAIQAGAISTNRLKKIMANANMETLVQFAMPRKMNVLSPSKLRRIENMAKAGYTISEIAKSLGISSTTVTKTLKEGS